MHANFLAYDTYIEKHIERQIW